MAPGLSAPAMIFSRASAISASPVSDLPLRAVRMAASFIKFSRSAPVIPGVRRAITAKSTFFARVLPLLCTAKILLRPSKSGRSTVIWRSNRPGRSRAESKTSGLLVAAKTITPLLPSKPSISVSSWLIVCSRSSLPPPIPAPRCRPTASISSMKTMQGAFSLARLKRSRTREAPTPTNSSTNSEAEQAKKGTPASPATALASKVFPVPGGPASRAPWGILAPRSVYFPGFLRKSTTSCSSNLAPSTPATSAKVTPVSGISWNLSLALPIAMGPFAPPPKASSRLRVRSTSPARKNAGRAKLLKNPMNPRKPSLGFST
mmetsp:Transcript_13291/g.23838  ORF Transcript_13291/g.23838 Transcript_13291/m.23838 type:complete len:318 (-) Transcript_13291:765-1718(-)